MCPDFFILGVSTALHLGCWLEKCFVLQLIFFSQKASALTNPQNEKRKNSNSLFGFFFWWKAFDLLYFRGCTATKAWIPQKSSSCYDFSMEIPNPLALERGIKAQLK